ncbi:MAG TPA: hypothetical protein VGQ82_08670 [Chthoniobacterales bacterium]|nr:hypothetical protein [Chthoniobacterales bacterium]
MNELINLVVQRTGISQEDAQKAVQVMVDFLKTKLPAPLASHLDSLLAGGMGASAIGGEAGELLKGALGGFFGGKK